MERRTETTATTGAKNDQFIIADGFLFACWENADQKEITTFYDDEADDERSPSLRLRRVTPKYHYEPANRK